MGRQHIRNRVTKTNSNMIRCILQLKWSVLCPRVYSEQFENVKTRQAARPEPDVSQPASYASDFVRLGVEPDFSRIKVMAGNSRGMKKGFPFQNESYSDSTFSILHYKCYTHQHVRAKNDYKLNIRCPIRTSLTQIAKATGNLPNSRGHFHPSCIHDVEHRLYLVLSQGLSKTNPIISLNLLYFEWSPPWHFKTATLKFMSAWSGQVRVDIRLISWNAFCYSQLRRLTGSNLLTFFPTLSSDILSDIIFWHSFWIIFWHIFWHSFWHAFWIIFWHIFWHSFWHMFWLTHLLAFFLTYLLTFFLTYLLTSLLQFFLTYLLTYHLTFFLTSLLQFFLTYLLTLFLTYLLTFFLT